MRDQGKTIVFVTHDMGSLNRFCHRALLLERGSIVHLGEPQEVGDRYLEINFGRDQGGGSEDGGGAGAGDARVVEAWVENGRGERVTAAPQGERIVLNARVSFAIDVDDPEAAVYVLDEDHRATLVASSALEHERSGQFRAGDQAVFSFAFDNVLGPGRYNPMFTVAQRGFGLDVIDRFEGSFSFVVTAARPLGGAVDLPVDVSVRRVSGVGIGTASAELLDAGVTELHS
jgi:hypothetical protein